MLLLQSQRATGWAAGVLAVERVQFESRGQSCLRNFFRKLGYFAKVPKYVCLPNSALKAGSTRPPLAVRTALTTAASMLGKASLNVASACCCGLRGRGGFAGADSSPAGCGEVGPEFSGSSSKSRGRAVVGDSAPEPETSFGRCVSFPSSAN